MSRRNSRVIDAQHKQIEELFRANANPESIAVVEVTTDKNCNVHGDSRRESFDSRRSSVVSNHEKREKRQSFCSTDTLNSMAAKKNRNSIGSFTDLVQRHPGFTRETASVERDIFSKYRESVPSLETSKSKIRRGSDTFSSRLFKGMEHPSNFPQMLRSSQSINQLNSMPIKNDKSEKITLSRRSSSNLNVSNGQTNGNATKRISISSIDKMGKRDYSLNNDANNNLTKKEFHPTSILKKRPEDDLKEIIKRLSFDYIEKSVLNGESPGFDSVDSKMPEIDVLSISGSSSGGKSSTTPLASTPVTKTPRRISIDSLASLDSRRSSRRFSDFSINGDDDIAGIDDHMLFINRMNHKKSKVNYY